MRTALPMRLLLWLFAFLTIVPFALLLLTSLKSKPDLLREPSCCPTGRTSRTTSTPGSRAFQRLHSVLVVVPVGGAAGAETSDIGAVAAPGRERRMTAGRKREAVLRLLRGEPLELVARELAVTAADLSGWRDAFLDGGSASLKSRPRDARDETIDRLRTKVGELTMDTELLQTKIARLEAGGAPFAARRSKR